MLARAMRSLTALMLAVGAVVALEPRAAGAATLPGLSVGGVRVVEAPAGTTHVHRIPVVLDRPSTEPVKFTWTISPGADAAVVAATGTGQISPGGQTTTIPVSIRQDSDDWEEHGTVTVSSVTGAVVERATGKISTRILECLCNPPQISVVVNDITIPEPDVGSVTFGFPVTVYGTFRQPIYLSWEMRSQYGAIAGSDGGPTSGTLKIPKHTPVTTFPVTVHGDASAEPKETLLIKPKSAVGPKGVGLMDPWGLIHVPMDDNGTNPLPWAPPPAIVSGPATTVYTEGDIGAWVGGGQSWHFTKANAGMKFSETDNHLWININGDSDATIKVPRLTTTGVWTNVPESKFDFSADAHGCNITESTLAVDRFSRAADGSLLTYAIRIEHWCAERPEYVTRLFLRYDKNDPTKPPPPGDPAGLAWVPPAGAVPATGSFLYLHSTPGNWLGQGQTYLMTPSTHEWRFQALHAGGIVGSADTPSDNWSFILGMPSWQPKFTRGLYPTGYGADDNSVKAPVDISGNGRACNGTTGNLAVDYAELDSAGLKRVDLRFEIYCDSDPDPMYGAFRWVRGQA